MWCNLPWGKSEYLSGHLGEDAPPHQPLLVKVDTVIAKEALYCAPCFEKRWAQL